MAGIGELAAGGAVGLAFTLLYDGVKDLVNKSKQFKPLLEELEITLNSLIPVIKVIEDHNRELDHQNDATVYLLEQLEKGKRLIDKLSTVGCWNHIKKINSNHELVELNNSLQRNVVLRLLPQVLINTQEILIRHELHDQVQNQNRGGETRATAPSPPSSPIGLHDPLMELKMMLLNDDQVSMLTVTGPGGSGKTTLAQMFCHDQDVKDRFSNRIFYQTVSSKPNLDKLETSLNKFRNEVEGNAALLVLDDVWLDSSRTLLEKIHQRSEWSGYKTLVTSRDDPKYGFHFPLKSLTDVEAMTLLKNSTSLDHSSGTLDELMKQIVKYCKRYPLAITVVGKSLFKESIEMWTEKATEWSKSTILEHHTVLLDRLQPSLDVLCNDKAIIKDCFIDLASLPEDGRIPAGVFVDMWAEVHGLSEYKSIVNLQELNNRNLAKLIVTSKENVYVDRCYSEQFVTQHDMLRELALHQITQKNNKLKKTRLLSVRETKRVNIDIHGDVLPEWWTQQRNKPKKTRLLSVSTDGVFTSKWDNMHLPKAEVLILNFQTKDYTFPKLNKKQSKALKVLIIRNNGLSPAEISNLELSSLFNLKRVRLERVSISSISYNKKKKLKSLEKISLFMCNIAQPSSSSSIQFFAALAALPKLVEINIEYCNDLKEFPADLCGLKCLKKLIITNCHNLSVLPEKMGELSNLQVLRLRSCTNLESLMDSIANLKNLDFLDISDCFSIKELPLDIGQLSKLKKINMRQCNRLKELPESILDLEEDTLKEVICDEDTAELWEPFKMMKNLSITVVKEEFNLRWLLSH